METTENIKKENSAERIPLQEKPPCTKEVIDKNEIPEEKPGMVVDETDGKTLNIKSENSFDEFVRII